ncbi:leukocyte elastase inhibitor-like [Ischnura elegans]|uniref:leukocyte elastase inhibitor-like n=1 Tax=Ischnura elegans TaxID=197161 RepID=UPI001ED87B95|nr:leukocyte elastase inhibitor-like [Ischnura elegans]
MWHTALVSLVLLLVRGATRTPTAGLAAATNVQRLSRAHFEFTLDLYRHLMDEPGGRENVIFSPYSITTVLSMLFLGAGANSNTSRQLREALHYNNLSYSEVHNAFKLVLENFHDSYYNDTVMVANGVFKQAGVPVSSYYERALQEFYKTQMDVVDFRKDEGSARGIINSWVSRNTGGKIPELLPRPLPSATKLLLVNALAMRARWLLRFEESHTFAKGLFYTHAQRRFEIPMMIGKFKLPLGYSQDLECRVLEIPFKERRISLFILLPDDLERGLARLEAHMSSDTIKALFSTLKDEMVNIRLPRFRVARGAELESTLVAMGVTDIFSAAQADLSGMSEDRGLHVGGIAHKTVLEIREDGAEASAATAAGLERVGTFGDKYFEVDHPFIFFIWDYRSGIVLFMGRVADPAPLND